MKEIIAEALKGKTARCLIGFDGFIDDIVLAVEKRIDAAHFHPFSTIGAFAKRIEESAEKSCNIELVLQQKKIGGNAPLMALGLLEGGHKIAFIGTIGEEEIEPLFLPLKERCEEIYSLGASGHSDAIEFRDGKVILGKLESLGKLTFEKVLKKIGEEKWFQLIEKLDLFASVNWTMLPMMNEMWEYLAERIAPKLSRKKRFFFVDLADPKKRSDGDLKRALFLLERLQKNFEVHLGLNVAEAERLAKLLSIKTRGGIEELAEGIKKEVKISHVIVHAKKGAAVATTAGGFFVKSAYVDAPLIATGAGDNFNAGYCNALLHGLGEEGCLASGAATAGYYVRKGRAPTREELAIFLNSME